MQTDQFCILAVKITWNEQVFKTCYILHPALLVCFLSSSAQVLFLPLLSNILFVIISSKDLCNTKPYPGVHAMAPIKVSISIKASWNRDQRDGPFISREFWFHISGEYSWTRRRESTFGFICVSFIFNAIILGKPTW